jgi:putative two-component system response regulator
MNTASDHFDAKILIVDDHEANVRLLQHILQGSGYSAVFTTTDPRSVCAMHRLHDFDIILLDLNMPGMDGFQVMAALKEIDSQGFLSILVLTAQPEHKLRALRSGAKDFVSKPFDHLEVLTRIHNLLEVQLLQKRLRAQNQTLEQRVKERTAALQDSYRETIHTIARAAECRDEDTGLHIQRISHYSRELAFSMGMDEVFCDTIFYASPLHDIGKIGIPDHILLKPGGFAQDEWAVMKTHVSVGADILAGGQSPYLAMGAQIALNHHERWDGGGYPNNLVGDTIPLAARIMNICDIYDALRSKRPYKAPFHHERAMEVIQHGDGRTAPNHFDPEVLQAFVSHQHNFREVFETWRG